MSSERRDKPGDDVDPRFAYIALHTLTTLRLKHEKWQKMITTDDLKLIVLDWLNNIHRRILLFNVNTAGLLVPSLSFPVPAKGKSAYFIKKYPAPVTADNFRTMIIFGDLPSHTVKSLATMFDEVFFPLVSCPLNRKLWPEIVSQDVATQMKDIRNILAEVKENISKRTILSVTVEPQMILEVATEVQKGNFSAYSGNIKNVLEGMVIKWTTQIHGVLKDIPEIDDCNYLPTNEVNFWNARYSNLHNILIQLRSPNIKTVGEILESVDSTYFRTFASTLKTLLIALQEAQDISLWIGPVLKRTNSFSEVSFTNSKDLIPPLVHTIYLIWTNSRYYCTTTKILRLLRAVSNLLVKRASDDLDLTILFRGDADEGVTKILKTIEIIEFYRANVDEYSKLKLSNVAEAFNKEPWSLKPEDFSPSFDNFLVRLFDLKNIFETGVCFQSLERIEIGGNHGKFFTTKIELVQKEFNTIFQQWTSAKIDLITSTEQTCNFAKQKSNFFKESQEIEKKLASILIKAIDLTSNMEQFVKLIQMTSALLKRPAIENDTKRALPKIFDLAEYELQMVDRILKSAINKYLKLGLEGISNDRNFPLVAGALMWIMKLQKRASNVLKENAYIDFHFIDMERSANEIARRNTILDKLNEFKELIWTNWTLGVEERIVKALSQFFIHLEPTHLRINFPEDICIALREAKCLNALGVPKIPRSVLNLYEMSDKFWQRRMVLSRVEEWYNSIRSKCSPCELLIIQKDLDDLDKLLAQAGKVITCQAYDEILITRIFNTTKDIYDCVCETQSNIQLILEKIRSWGKDPLYKRRTKGKKLLDIDCKTRKYMNRVFQCLDTKSWINRLMTKNFLLFFKQPYPEEEGTTNAGTLPPKQEEISTANQKSYLVHEVSLFKEYREFVDSLIAKEIRKAVKISLDYIKTEMRSSFEQNNPLFEVKLQLEGEEVKFSPEFDSNTDDNFLQRIRHLIEDILRTSELIPKVCGQVQDVDIQEQLSSSTYSTHVHNDQEISSLSEHIVKSAEDAIRDALEYAATYNQFEHLWTYDVEQQLDYQFSVVDGSQNGGSPQSKTHQIDIEWFKAKIDYYHDLQECIEKLETYRVFRGWLGVDMSPIKYAVVNHVCKWANLYKQYLVQHVINTLKELEIFINTGLKVLVLNVREDNFSELLQVMKVLLQTKNKQNESDDMFKPLKETISLLKFYGVNFKTSTYKKIEELPQIWSKFKDFAKQRSEEITPVLEYQQTRITSLMNIFKCQLNNYREAFTKMPFFSVPCESVYQLCNEVNFHLMRMEKHFLQLSNYTQLFGLATPDDTNLRLCYKEIKQVKQLWDFVEVIDSCIIDWKSTSWVKIDADDVENECRKFTKELRTLDKSVRTWKPYTYLEGVLKDLVSSLRAITELQNPAITERHWVELMHATKLSQEYGLEHLIRIKLDDDTTLSDLLSLNLHNFEEEVKNTVDRAVKEMAVAKVLNEIKLIWNGFEFEYEIHEQRQVHLLRVSEELIETLDENQMQLQNIASSKYVDYLLPKVSMWQQTLSSIDRVISLWFEVQRKWIYLESIFIGSPDIRAQLPDDSKRFEVIDCEFLRLLRLVSASKMVKNVIENQEVYDSLEKLLIQLVLCEKALNNYLEKKRLAFPRFYFISSVDLLDILSNGNNPRYIDCHLIKLFDSILRLRYEPNSKMTMGMYSKENDEYVPFIEPFECRGKVEVWLNKLIDSMRKTLYELFKRANFAYGTKHRDKWLFDWPAQTAVCCSQIYWTLEVNRAFELQEEGYENAMKDYQRTQIAQLTALINLLLGELAAGDRQKIMTICTIDVHCRDVVAKLIQLKVENAMAFQWQSQLRHRWDDDLDDCFANICDAEFQYAYEYLGNTSRLVITPLTDRCYITLTQSLHLVMGGAPAGPAGTGKTETTKDLGRALGVMVYVFNCSEQMDYKSCGSIYKGLAQTGAWGCFDEFNRISIEVLSVVAVQVKTIQDAIKLKKTEFMFMGEMIPLSKSVGIFITMNPGYAGRTELPENLKTLFRPCAMIVPDFALICEIMLVAEGFQEARLLARKFITLYTLCRELLSKQDHYDWGLRAIKSVLVVAGALKRDDYTRPEDQVLMRALRDFNIPKIVTEDIPIFMGLIGDLFPSLDVPRKRILQFEKTIRRAANAIKLQTEEGFVMKVVQLQELLHVRHSVFIVGNAGTGKTKIWQTLLETYKIQKLKPLYSVLNPKALTSDELFGVVNPTTREWKDGLFSAIMRNQASSLAEGPKWIVLDGDIDPMWIESLNTLMDDNKILTLASNERITLKRDMRLIFEVGHLKAATPATVSRAGILYINPQDLGWYSYISSWIETRRNIIERATLVHLFEKYFPLLTGHSKNFKRMIPVSEIALVQTTCHLLECLLDEYKLNSDTLETTLEIVFAFASIWGFGSGLFQDHLIDWRKEFHKWWLAEFKEVRLPPDGLIFDYYLDMRTLKFKSWNHLIQDFEFDPEVPLQNVLVPTVETTRLTFFLKLLMEKHHPVMLVGASGSGKNAIFREIFNSCQENVVLQSTNFNFYTNSEMFQRILDKPLERKSGRCFGPMGNKSLIYYVSDLNMPEVDSYGTVQAHTIIRQFMDYKQWYDRSKLVAKDIRRCQFAASMNPTAGSFTIDPRLQRHFCVFSVNSPSEEILEQMYSCILSNYMECPLSNFSKEIKAIGQVLVSAGVALHRRMEFTFLPTAVKFHYAFNLRDLTNIYQGVINANSKSCSKPKDLIRLYIHEAFRVYHDKLVDQYDIKTFKAIIRDVFKKDIEDFDEEYTFSEPLLYCHFSQSLLDQKYMPVKSWPSLHQLLMEAQDNYNEIVGHMNLVMFEDAMVHVCRINRILESPRSNALLIGVGGSGKQTLAKLAAFISSLNVFQIQLKRGYSIQDFKTELSGLYTKVGLKNFASAFIMSDAQIPEEHILMLVNDMLASGEIPDLFSDEQLDSVINGVRNEVKQTGELDTKENCWKFFIEKVRRLLKIVLCFSPVGPTLRIRARKFPAITSKTSIDWFHGWPSSALVSVAKKFLSELEILPKELIDSIGCFMAYVHDTVNQISRIFLQNEKRYNYTTPKTFLEFISLYSKLLIDKSGEYSRRIKRLESGMSKLEECAQQVDTLQDQLATQEIELNAKNSAADKLIVMVSAEQEKVKREKLIASEEEKRVRIIEEDVSLKMQICEQDLRKAEPALVAAQAALNTLNKNNLTELKSFGSPPKAVVNVCAAVMVLLAPNGKIPKDRSWKIAKLMMGKVDQFLSDLVNYEKDNIHPFVIEALQEYLKDPEFNPDKIVQKSVAAAGLCAWVINLHKYHEVFLIVGPKQQALQSSQEELQEARERLEYLKKKIADLEEKLSCIQSEFQEALLEKQKCQEEADKTAFTIDLANRLVNGLGNENIRWRESVSSLKNKIGTLPGDILLISSFLSYVGCFTRRYREELQEKMWMPTFNKIEPAIPHTGVDPLALISDDAQIASWNNEGLPMDRMSTENATILSNSTRWPLMIDPQLQGIKWIKNKFGKDLIVLRVSQKGYLDFLEKAMARGDTVLMEQIGETLDAVLEPLLSRALIKKGRCIKIGDREMDFHYNFRLILHTKLANPHYKPEIQAQTTLINFTVTRDGLEEQLLAEVVKMERPDLEKMKTNITVQQNKFKISLKHLEDELLARLASAGENILAEHALVTNLEDTKKTVDVIEMKVAEARVTSLQIDEARDIYRAAAKRSSILYFVLNDLQKINPIYKFSLKAFIIVFKRAIAQADQGLHLEDRVQSLVESITYQTFLYTSRGLFEKDKLTFTSHMVIQIMIHTRGTSKEEVDYLLRYPHDQNSVSPLDFVSKSAWNGLKTLTTFEYFYGIDKDVESYPKRWQNFVTSDMPEKEQFPGEWKNRTPLQKLCIIRTFRPDRMTYAMKLFIEQMMGKMYVEGRMIPFDKTYDETTSFTPVFFVLSPGIDPVADVEKLGKQLKISSEFENFHNISLGQGQELLADAAIQKAGVEGHWVVLQNIHLVVKWLPSLDKLIESTFEKCHPNFRLFISSEPAVDPECHVIPQGILESSIKIVNEPPSGLAANLHKAWENFNQETLEMCTQEAEFKAILFSLCYFHAVVGERRKFGTQGWNKIYPFNVGDLVISANVLHNYLEGSTRIPWEDLRYLFGEIMYGGHITDDWDRRLCQTYLKELMRQELIDGDFELCPGFPAPPNLDFVAYHDYIDDNLPEESPLLYGLHPNAEIGFLMSASESLLKTVFELQPRESELTTDCGASREELVKIMSDDMLDKLQDEFNLSELMTRIDRKSPFVIVALQECERINSLVREIKRSLRELLLGLKGELTITAEMEKLDNALFYNHVPESWEKLAYPSLLGLQSWFVDLTYRIRELTSWSVDFSLPSSVWLGGLFNPQSFLTAIMQESARRNDLPLDRMCLSCEVTRLTKDDISLPPKEGAFVNGIFLDGASWDCISNSIVQLGPKELFSCMPVIYIKSIIQEKQKVQRIYECPLYKTRARGSTYVWTFNLRSKERPPKWILSGVALLLQT